ncbi:ANL family adenylate-forming protein [Enterococcus sp. AZ020]|uniref:ANL family adenylate-forming protein n=1 Tax=Enterococcus sp. AZ020 TaxID=2774650 RepID=UPI003D27410A
MENAKNDPEKIIFQSEKKKLTNRDLYEKVQSCMDYLNACKVFNQKILIEFFDEIEIIPMLIATITLGINICLVDLKRENKSKNQRIAIFRPDIIITDRGKVSVHNEFPIEWIYSSKYVTNKAGSKSCTEDRLVLTIFTSGSTGVPKGIKIMKSNIYFCIESILKILKLSSEDKIGLFLPITFDYGLYHIFFAVIKNCRLEFFSEEYSEFALLSFILERKITFLPSLPKTTTNLIWLAKRNKWLNLLSLKTITNTGEYLSPSIQELIWKQNPNLNIYFMYGITECKRVSILTPEEFKFKPNSVGKPLPGTKAYVLNHESNKLSEHGYGELVIEGPSVTSGYLSDVTKEETTHYFEVENTRYFRTGDQFYIDQQGYLFFKGRNSGFIKYNGYRIDPLEIESIAMKTPKVVFAKVFTLDDHFFLVYQGECSEEILRDGLKLKLDKYKIPKVLKIKKMPLTSNRKIDFLKLKKYCAELENLTE